MTVISTEILNAITEDTHRLASVYAGKWYATLTMTLAEDPQCWREGHLVPTYKVFVDCEGIDVDENFPAYELFEATKAFNKYVQECESKCGKRTGSWN